MSSRLERVSRAAAAMRKEDTSRLGRVRRLNGESTLDTVRARSEAAQKQANEEAAIRKMKYASQMSEPPQLTPAERYAQSRINNTSSDRRLNAMEQRLDPGTSVKTTRGQERAAQLDAIIDAEDNRPKKTVTMQNGALVVKNNTNTKYNDLVSEYKKTRTQEQLDKDLRERRKERNQIDTKAFYDEWGAKYNALPESDRNALDTIAKNEGHSFVDKTLGGLKSETREARKSLEGRYSPEELEAYSRIAKEKNEYETYQEQDRAYKEAQDKLSIFSAEDKEALASLAGTAGESTTENLRQTGIKFYADKYGIDTDEAEILAILQAREQNKIDREQYEKWLRPFVKDHPWLSLAIGSANFMTAPFNAVGILSDISDASKLEKLGYKGKIDLQGSDNPLAAASNLNAIISEENGDRMDGWYNTIMQSVNNIAVNTLLPGGTGFAAFALGAAPEGIDTAKQNGADWKHQLATGAAYGANEAIWEKVSWGSIGKIEQFTGGIVKGGNVLSRAANWLSRRLVDSGLNGLEEVNTDLANDVADYLINGDYSKYGLMANTMKLQGYSQDEITDAIAKDVADNYWETFKEGAKQGFLMGGVNSAMQARSDAQTGKNLRLGEYTPENIADKLVQNGYSSDVARSLANDVVAVAINGDNSTAQARISMNDMDGVLFNLVNETRDAVKRNTEVINSSAQEMGITPQGETNIGVSRVSRLAADQVSRNMEVKRSDLYNQFREQGASGIESAVKAYKASKLNEKVSNWDFNKMLKQEREDYLNRGELSSAINQATEKKAAENSQDLASLAKMRETVENTKQKVSATGETSLADTGEAIKSYKVTGIERNVELNKENVTSDEFADIKIEVTLDNGKTKVVSPTDINYSNNSVAKAVDVLSTVATATDIDTETANFILNSVPLISNDYSARTIATAIQTAYDYGKYNLPIGVYGQTSVGILGENMFNAIKKFGENNLDAETTGLVQSIAKATAMGGSKKGVATFRGKEITAESIDNDKSLSDVQKDSLRTALFIAEASGLKIAVFESTEAQRESGTANGWFSGDVLTIDINAGRSGTMMFTLAHELTHFIKQWSPAQFNNLAKFVMKRYGEKGVNVESLIQHEINLSAKRGHKLSRAAAYEEVVCNAMETMLTDNHNTVVNHLAELNKENPELYKKMKGEVDRIGDAVSKKYKEHIENGELTMPGKYISDLKDELDELRKMFAEALQKAGENYRKAGSVEEGTKYQLRDIPSDDEIKKNFTDVASMKPVAKMTGDEFAKGETDLVTQVSNYFDSIGNIVATKHGDIILNREGVKDSLGHGMGRAKAIAYKAVPQVLREGKILSFTKNYKGQKTDRAVFFAPIKIGNDEYFEAVIVTAGLNDNHFYLHEVMAIRKDGKSPFKTGSKTSGEMSSIYNILQRLVNVKTESKFQDREPIEETKNLLAIHNTTEEKLFASLKMGGFPMPSIAIVKDTMGHDKFGGISVVFGKDTIDPALPNNKVYGSDAYTPTRISVEHKVNSKAINSIHDKVKEMIEREGISYNDLPYSGLDSQNAEDKLNRNQGDIYDAYGTTDALKIAYASEKGIPFIKQYFEKQINPRLENEIVKMLMSDSAFMERIKEYINNDEYIDPNNISEDTVYDLLKFINKACQEYYQLDNDELYTYNRFGKYETSEMLNSIRRITQEGIPRTFDNRTAVDSINEAISKDDRKDYKNWLNELFEGVVEKKGIRNKTDLFTPSGNRRSFEQLHWEYTLENIVRAMKSQDFQKGQTFGGVSITGSATRNFKSLKEIKENSSKLNLETEKEFNDKQREFGDRFHNLAYEFAGNGDYRSADGCEEVMVEAINKYSNLNLDSIKAYLKRESQGWANYKDSIAEELVKLVKDIRDMPTGYFEAKPQRAVGLGEIKAVVVPSNVSPRLKTWLSNRGINNIVEYEAGNEKDRLAKLNSIEDVKFQERDQEYFDALDKFGEDSEEVAKIIERAAEDAGYNSPTLYHGTQRFGFTWFDLSKMDDGMSIFLTSDKRMAMSYSGVGGTRKISSIDRKAIKSLHGKELVDKANQIFAEGGITFKPYKYWDKAKVDSSSEIYAKSKAKVIELLRSGIEKEQKLIDSFADKTLTIIKMKQETIAHLNLAIEYLEQNRFNDAREEIGAYAHRTLDFDDFRVLFHENMYEMGIISQIYEHPENLSQDGGAIIHLGSFVSEDVAREKALAAPAEGNYQLKAKLGKSLVVDAKGANWNNIPFNLRQLGDISNYDYIEMDDAFELINIGTGEMVEFSYPNNTDTWLYSPARNKLEEIYREYGGWNHDSILKALYTMATDERVVGEPKARTRDIAKWAYENGYDSVVFQNLYDDGGRGNGLPIPAADVYVIFNPNFIKSIDPVTYDDDGNIIPPSQRFNEGEKDFRYQNREMPDSEKKYLANLKKSTYNEYQTNLMIWFHGSAEKGNLKILYQPKSRNWVLFEKGDDAPILLKRSKKYNEVRDEYDRLYDEANALFDWNVEKFRGKQAEDDSNLQLSGNGSRDEQNSGLAMREGQANDSRGSGANLSESDSGKGIANEERSAENGGALSDAKLQEREAPEERELPYFLDKQEQDEVFAILEEMNRARDEIFNGGELSDDEEFWNAKTVPENSRDGVRTLNKGQRQKVKKETVYQLIRRYKKKFAEKGSPFSLENVDKATDMLQKLYEDMQNDSNIAWEEAYRRARDVAIEVVKYTNWYDEIVHPGKNYERRIRQRRFNPYGRLQDDEGNDTSKGNNFLVEDEFLLTPIINEILTDYFDLPVSNAAAVKRASVKANYENKIGELKRQLKDLEKERRELVKDKTKAERRAIIEQRRNERYHETVEKRNQKAQIKKVADSIIKKLVTNGDQSTKHIPEELKKSIIEFANLINDSGAFDSGKSERLQSSLLKLSNALEGNNDDNEEGDANMMSMYDKELREAVNTLAQNIGNRRLTDLTSAELKEIKDITRYIRHIIVTANKAFSSNIKEGIDEMGASANMEIRSQGKSRIFATKVQTGMIKPVYFFDMLGSPTLSRLYENIRNGELEWYRVIDKAKDFRAETQKKYNYDDWKDDTVTVKLSSGDIELTIEEALSLYATIKRSNGQGANHLMQGGFSTENLVLGKDKGLIGRTKDAVERTVKKSAQNTRENLERTKRRISADEMTAFVQSLTTEQREYADALVGYMSNDMASLGNEVTMKLYGIRKFLEDYYFPISSDPNSLFDNGGGNMGNVDNRIKHLSMTKSLTNKANNPLIIGDFTETCMRHCSDMGLYYGFCLPMEDFNRVYNYKGVMPKKDSGTDKLQANVKDAIRDTFITSDSGNSRTKNNAIDYISNLRRDINGRAGRDAGGQMVAKMVSLAKKNAVFGSMSVAVQQPSALMRAFRYINPKYFAKTTLTKRDYDECKKYCAVAGIKDMGFFDVGVGRNATEYMLKGEYKGVKEKAKAIKNDSAYRDELLSKLPSVMDEVTWAHIWNACKAEIKDTTNLEEGSAEFYEAAAKRFTYVIDRTQVYDSVFSRSQFMRSKDTGAQVATAFMAEPTTALNMLYSGAFGKLQNGETRKQAAGKSIAAFLAAVAFNSLLKSLVTASRHVGKDDNEDKSWWELYINEFFSNAKDDLIPLNYIPYAKDLVSLLQGYDTDRMDTQAISMIVKAYQQAEKDGFSYESVKAIASAIGVVTGVPFANVMKDIEGVKNIGERMIETFEGEGKKTTPEGVGYAVRDAIWEPKKANQYGLLVDAYIKDRPASVDKFEKDLIYHSNNGELSKTYLGDAVKKRLKSGKITRRQAEDILVRFYGYKDGGTAKTSPRYKAESKVAEWLEETD